MPPNSHVSRRFTRTLKAGQNRDKKTQPQFFLAHLLAMLLAVQPRSCLVVGSVGLTVGLAIGRAVSTGGEVAVGLSGWSLWKC